MAHSFVSGASTSVVCLNCTPVPLSFVILLLGVTSDLWFWFVCVWVPGTLQCSVRRTVPHDSPVSRREGTVERLRGWNLRYVFDTRGCRSDLPFLERNLMSTPSVLKFFVKLIVPRPISRPCSRFQRRCFLVSPDVRVKI